MFAASSHQAGDEGRRFMVSPAVWVTMVASSFGPLGPQTKCFQQHILISRVLETGSLRSRGRHGQARPAGG